MKPRKKDFYWTYIAQVINIGGGVIALPLVLAFWDVNTVNNYLILITLMALFAIIDGGIRLNLARVATFAISGKIPEYGSTTNLILKNLNQHQIFSVMHELLLKVSLIGGTSIFSIGALYLYISSSPSEFWGNIINWILISISQLLFIRNLSIIGALQGFGKIALANKLVAAFKGGILLSCICSVLLGFGLFGFALGSTIFSTIIFYITQNIYHLEFEKDLIKKKNISVSKVDTNKIYKLILKPSIRLWIVHGGGFMINRGGILVAGLVLGVAEASSFMLTITVISVVANLASVVISIYLPLLNSIQVSDSKILLPSIVKKIYSIAYTVFCLGFVGIYFFGDYLLAFIGSEAKLIENNLLLVIGFIFLLEVTHSIAAIYLTTKNEIIFAKAAVLSGLTIVIFGYFLGATYGILGLILAQGIVQLIYNNWRWPQLMLRDLRGSYV
jgi:O-antigen/teichoic acid export membrane protein